MTAAPGAEAPLYRGSCHCGAVQFTARTRIEAPFMCNCSRCRRLNMVMTSVPAADFSLVSGGEMLKTYRFNSHKIAHQFCIQCGVQSFSSGTDQKGNALYVINVHCLEDAPYDKDAITQFNGADF